MTQLAKELLNESQTSRCIINYMIDTWNDIKDKQPKDVWFEGEYLSQGDFIHKTIFDLILLAKINADENYENGNITLEQLNETYSYFGIGTIGIGTLEKHNVGWVLMHSNGITEIKEDGKFGYLCKDEYDRCKVSYHRKPNRKIEIRGLVNVLKEQTIS